MHEFPIILFLQEVGTLSWERDGLYYRYTGKITCSNKGFFRLYLHQNGKCTSLGVFSPQGELCGRIAARNVHGGDCVFSLTRMIWYPKYNTIAATEIEHGELLFVHRYKPLPCEILPYVCFLSPIVIENLPGLSVTLDKQGRPII